MEIKKNLWIKILKKVIKSFVLSFYIIFIISLISGGIAAGTMTLIPAEASKTCYLGYYAHCSFTPFSTLILFAMASLGIFLLLKFIKYTKRLRNKAIEKSRT